MSLAGEVRAGKDEIVLFSSEGLSQNDRVQMADIAGARWQSGHGFHMTEVTFRPHLLILRRHHYPLLVPVAATETPSSKAGASAYGEGVVAAIWKRRPTHNLLLIFIMIISSSVINGGGEQRFWTRNPVSESVSLRPRYHRHLRTLFHLYY